MFLLATICIGLVIIKYEQFSQSKEIDRLEKIELENLSKM